MSVSTSNRRPYVSLFAFAIVLTIASMNGTQNDESVDMNKTTADDSVVWRNNATSANCLASQPSCQCSDRRTPRKRLDKGWEAHHQRMAQAAAAAPSSLDVVLIGDSITERWNGTRRMGQMESPAGRGPFEKYFTKAGGGTLDGIALGSGGDRTTNIVWHLRNGMLPDTLQPKVWVVLIGTNDIGSDGCSPERAVEGVVEVVKELRTKRPDSKILLHGLLPRSDKMFTLNLGEFHRACMRANEELKKIAESSDFIHYMEAGAAFLKEEGENGVKKIIHELMDDGLHPNESGMHKWGPLIVEEVVQLLSKL
eukprot:CAMPEP_0116549960 /NCGR_PEP_ID=MMETSP0397-20121206/5165_1 /TAXON_ID=216820 /ORGANISM="Cyclophora tenuis, Strain ECT3854" /LENGTH=309 /DNA_ID=CAMNT_0004074745 /DNA_START=76 /DNA_END=1005 /DNA_ORIENTATION=+